MKTQLNPLQVAVRAALAVAFLFCAENIRAQSGTWTNNPNGTASGSWTNSVNWLNGIIAGGVDSTANFNTLDITNGSTVTLDGNQTNGTINIADVVASTNWTFNAGTPSTSALWLSTSSSSPAAAVINVADQIATFGATIFGTNGFSKTGAGTLRLNAANTNAFGSLSGLIIVTNGILQAGNASAFGGNGVVIAGASTNEVICTNGGTIEMISAIAVNNELLVLGGTGNGRTNGALYANTPTSAGSTRWGLSSLNASGVSANSSVSAPGIILVTNATIRVDGAAVGAFSNVFLAGYITSSTNTVANITNSFFTLTKTGTGRLEFERGMMVSNVVVQAGSVFPDSANAFNAVQYWTVQSGGAIYNDQQNTFNATTITLEVDAGGVYDVNFRGSGVPGSDNNAYTQNLGTLTGAGIITCGERGQIAAQALNITSTNYSSFSGTITDTNGDVLNFGKTGAGSTLLLSGTNTYHGTTTVSAGTLLMDGISTGGSNYVVNAGAVLGGKGTIIPNAPNVINLSGTLVAGDNGGTLTVSNVVGTGDVFVTNANLAVLGQLNSSASGSYLNSLNLTNCMVAALLQQNGTEASIYANSVNIDGVNNILSFTTANPALGQFPFIKYAALGGQNGFAGLQLQSPTGITAFLSNNVANSSIDIVVTATPTLVWNGTPTGDWSIGGSANWLNVSTPTAYSESGGTGPFVVFNDAAVGVTTVNLTTTVTPKGITVNNTNKNYTYTGSGLINGNGTLEKDGTGTLTFANTATNTYAGTITINAGAVSLGNGGTVGNLGAASVVNSSSLIFNRSDNVTIGNAISGTGSLVNQGTGTATLTGVGNIGGAITVNAGTLALAPAGIITVSGDVTGAGAFGVTGSGTVKLSSGNVTYSGGTVISNGTLELDNAFPPSGNISDNGILAVGVSGTLVNNVSGAGGVALINGAEVTLAGMNTYAGPTVVSGGSVNAMPLNYPSSSVLVLGDQVADVTAGTANFTSGNPVLGGLNVGGNPSSVNMGDNGQTLSINGNMSVGSIGPVGASVSFALTGTGVTLVVNTNGGTIQLGLGATGSGVNPDNVFVDFSGIDNFVASLGTNGAVNLGTLDGNPGPPAGASVVNWFNLAAVSNSITAGAINIGAGGRQLVPELRLGAGTNILNVNALTAGYGGRDGSYLYFLGGTGGLRVRAYNGVSRAAMAVGNNPGTGTGASITNTVDFTGHPVDLLFSTLTIGNYNNAGVYQNTFSFDTGVLDAQSTSLSLIRNNNGANAAASSSTLNIGGGTASLGPVNLTASVAAGTLNITGGTVTVQNITAPGTGLSTLNVGNATLNLNLAGFGNPPTAPVAVQTFNVNGPVNLGVNGTGFAVGQFPLISYTGSIGGSGFAALTLASLPANVAGYLSNNTVNASVDLVITSAPPAINPNPPFLQVSVAGNTLSLGWPTNLGWILQTNSVSLTASGSWFAYNGSTSVTNVNIPLNPTQINVFFRMMKP